MTSRAGNSGTTLLEVLVALALMSTIAVALASIGKTGSQTWLRQENGNYDTAYALARYQLREDLEALDLVALDRPLGEIFRFDETDQSIRVFVPNKGEWLLDWSESSFWYAPVNISDSRDHQLYPNSIFVSVSFYGAKSPRGAVEWSESWTGATLVPLLIKFEVQGADGRVYPPLTIQPSKITRHREISASSLFPPG